MLSFDVLKGCLTRTAEKYTKNKNTRANAITINLKTLNDALTYGGKYKVGSGTEKEFLIANCVIQCKSKINYVIDIAKLFFIYVDISTLGDIECLLLALKKEFPECVNSETYQQELSDFLETTGLESIGDDIVQNPYNTGFKHIEA